VPVIDDFWELDRTAAYIRAMQDRSRLLRYALFYFITLLFGFSVLMFGVVCICMGDVDAHTISFVVLGGALFVGAYPAFKNDAHRYLPKVIDG
jgi:hypothetical protein